MAIRYLVFFMSLFTSLSMAFPMSENQPKIEERFFAKSNIWVDDGVLSSDYRQGTMLPIGTSVLISQFDTKQVLLTVEKGEISNISLVQSELSDISLKRTFYRYFDKQSPIDAGALYIFSDDIKKNILAGRVKKGMSKAAVLMSYGHPPTVKTDIDSDDVWTYWFSSTKPQVLTFSKNKLINIYPSMKESVEPSIRVPVNKGLKIEFIDEDEQGKTSFEDEKRVKVKIEKKYNYLENYNSLKYIKPTKVLYNAPLGKDLSSVVKWLSRHNVKQIYNFSEDRLKKDLYQLLWPREVDKDALDAWSLEDIKKAVMHSDLRLRTGPDIDKKAAELVNFFTYPYFNYMGTKYFLTHLASGIDDNKLVNYSLELGTPEDLSRSGVNKVIFYFNKNKSGLVVNAVEYVFWYVPEDVFKSTDHVYGEHKLIKADSKENQALAKYIASMLAKTVPNGLASAIWTKNIFLLPGADLSENIKAGDEFYSERLFTADYLKVLAKTYKNYYSLFFVLEDD